MTGSDQSSSDDGVYELDVTRVVQETADARSFVLVPPTTSRGTFRYRSGQFLTFEIPFGDQTLRRCYSMSSSPETEADLSVTVKRVPGGLISNWFNDCVRPGSRLRVLPPAGRFTLTNSDAPILFLAGGSGITPIISLVKSALSLGSRPMTLLYANRSRASIIFHDVLERLAKANSHRLTVIHHIDEEAGPHDPRRVVPWSRLSPDVEVYLCGPAPFMDSIEAALHEQKVSPDRIFIEKFVSPSVQPQAAPSQASGVFCRMTIWADGASRIVDARPDETILQAARRAGVRAPSACEQGVCGTCLAKLSHGKATMRSNLILTDQEIADGMILTCQAIAANDHIEVRYD